MTISLNLTESQFDYITKLEVSATDQNDVLEQEEGERTLKLHQSIERKPELISAFKLCTFYFEGRYGSIGKAFVECHHIRPCGSDAPRGTNEIK
jgi:predicted HNH restriction endonuclease